MENSSIGDSSMNYRWNVNQLGTSVGNRLEKRNNQMSVTDLIFNNNLNVLFSKDVNRKYFLLQLLLP
jgi:hypothetical protein